MDRRLGQILIRKGLLQQPDLDKASSSRVSAPATS